jgi:hypothetical protein
MMSLAPQSSKLSLMRSSNEPKIYQMGGQRESNIASGNAMNQTMFIEKADFSKP